MKKIKRFVSYIIIMVIIVSILIFYTWQKIEIISVGYKIQKLTRKLNELDIECKKLEFQANKLASLKRIDKIAKEKLFMIKPRDKDLVILNK